MEPATQAFALTGNLTRNLSLHSTTPNQQSHAVQGLIALYLATFLKMYFCLFEYLLIYLFLLLAFTGFRGSATLQCLFYKYVLHLETMLSVDVVYIGILNF